MKLYFHIGTEKTGSSFLQSYLARNRTILEKHAICYPHAGVHEANVQKGIITPGNAEDLQRSIDALEWPKVKEWLAQKKKEAQKKQCDTLLISNEILVLSFSKEGVLAKVIDILEALEISCEGLLLIIREPVSQALSLYKHRTKSGTFTPIQEWLENQYFIAGGLKDFYTELSKTNIKLSQFEYKKDSEYLVNVCINDWLGLNEDIKIEQQKSVNPSLSLSELVLLCEIFQNDEILAKKFYQFMIRIDVKDKSDDKYLKGYVKNHINNYMVKHNELWNIVNQKMSTTKSNFNYKPCKVTSEEKITSFSTHQIKTISKFIEYSKSKSFRKHKIKYKTIVFIGKNTPKFIYKLRKKLLYRT